MERKGRRHAGFTLVEMMVTIAVAAIILSLAVPSFNFLVQDNRLTTDINRLVTSFNLARSEAVKRGVRVEISARDGADWRNGWVVRIPGEDFVVEQALNPLMVLNSTGGSTSFIYQADGSIDGASDTLNLCDSSRTGEIGRSITVNVTGRIDLDSGFACP